MTTKKSLAKEIWKAKNNYLFAGGYLIVFFVFTVLPVIIAILMSFTYYNLLQSPKFVFIQNYLNLLTNDNLFWISLKNTLLFAAVTGPIGYFMSMFFAWLINEIPKGLRVTLTLFFYAPSISGAAFSIWAIILSGDSYGYLNAFLMKFGFINSTIQWLADPKYLAVSCMVVIIWMSLGPGFLSFVAGFKCMDKTLFEAAAIDGIKNRYQELWFITLPYLRPQMLFGAVMSITASFTVGAVITGLCGFPSTDYKAYTIVHHLEDYGGVRFDLGYACAIATVLFLLMLFINLIVQRLIQKVGK